MTHLFRAAAIGGKADLIYRGRFSRYRHIPFLLGRDLSYLEEANEFLREETQPSSALGQEPSSYAGKRKLPSENTLLGKARSLENFFTYLEATGGDWRQISYNQLLETYDADMASGRWSVDGKPLAPATINLRVGFVCQFLTWAAKKEYRAFFDVPVTRKSRVISTGRSSRRMFQEISQRIGARRVNPTKLRLPTVEEINGWLEEIAHRRGPTKALACKTILNTNMRLEEVVLLRSYQVADALRQMNQAPEHLDDPLRLVPLDICYGTKGGRELGDTDKVGKPRTLKVQPAFMWQLERYGAKQRPFSVHRFKANNPGAAIPPQFFLSEETGERLSRGSLYNAWHECQMLPFAGWSPHLGRHAWACFTLLSRIEREREIITAITAAGAVPTGLIIQLGGNIIDTLIRPAMGHVSEETTDQYLGWVSDHLSSTKLRLAWADYLDGADE